MKRITFQQLINTAKKLSGQNFEVFITCPKRPLQTRYTEKVIANVITASTIKQDRILNIMSRRAYGFKKAMLYVNDTDYIKYF